MGVTDDPSDPRIVRGEEDTVPVPQNEVYLVLSEEERAKGFVRPVRHAYRHVGPVGARYPLRDLTDDERERYDGEGYVSFEAYPDSEAPKTGRYWTQGQLDAVAAGGCGAITTMGTALSETYARQPSFYGATYCSSCQMHRRVGAAGEFVWVEPDGTDGPRVGT